MRWERNNWWLTTVVMNEMNWFVDERNAKTQLHVQNTERAADRDVRQRGNGPSGHAHHRRPQKVRRKARFRPAHHRFPRKTRRYLRQIRRHRNSSISIAFHLTNFFFYLPIWILNQTNFHLKIAKFGPKNWPKNWLFQWQSKNDCPNDQ